MQAFWLQDLVHDIRFAVRLLLRERGFAATALLVLGLGIGVNNMQFTIVYAHTLRGLPIERPGRVLFLSTVDGRGNDRGVSYLDFQDLRASARSFSGFTAFFSTPVALGDDGRAPERVEASYVTAGDHALLGIGPAFGRGISADDDRPGAPAVVVLGSRVWHSRYGGDRAILGRTVLIDGAAATVIGVMPNPSRFPSTSEIWLPLAHLRGLAAQTREARTLRVVGRVRDDVSIAAATLEVESIVDRLSQQHLQLAQAVRARLTPINQRFLGRSTEPAWLAFMTAGFLVFAVSCANVANLMLGRAIQRGREIAVRVSLGASRRRVVRQLLIESAVLAALAALVGTGVSLGGARLFGAVVPENVLPYWMDYTMDVRVFGALVAVSVGAVLVFGLVPALQTSKADVNRVLKMGGRTSTAPHGARWWTSAFLTAQVALTVILLCYVVIDVRSTEADLATDLAIDDDTLLTASLTLPSETYRTPAERRDAYRRLGERIAAVPGVQSIAAASALPRRGAAEQRFRLANVPEDKMPAVWTIAVGPRYFATLGLPLLRGREFTEEDGHSGEEPALVNQRFADMFFAGQEAVGRHVTIAPPEAAGGGARTLIVVGVAQSIRQRGGRVPDPIVYRPLAATAPATVALLLRATGDQAAIATALREAVRSVDPNLPIYRVLTMPQTIYELEWNGRVASGLVRTLTFITLLLTVVGLYAVTAHTVNQRTQEIGVRMAVGARPLDVGWLVLRRAFIQLATGLGAGVLATLAWDATFFSGAEARRFTTPGVLLPVAAVLATVTLIACLLPFRRSMRIDPAIALRDE